MVGKASGKLTPFVLSQEVPLNAQKLGPFCTNSLHSKEAQLTAMLGSVVVPCQVYPKHNLLMSKIPYIVTHFREKLCFNINML